VCGIAGLLDHRSPSRDDLLQQMTAALFHRGPDEDGYHCDDHVALGMRRLAIQDVRHGQQPAHDESQTVTCVFNGELYNVGELQEMLRARGHRLASDADTDCIPHLYEEFGLGFVDHLRGMFAVAVWDARRRRLVLARDRLGKKPLYYWHRGERLTFASELKALLVDPSLERRADPVALSHYLTLQYVPAPWSAVEGVRKLPPGHLLVADDDGVRVDRYWTLHYRPEGEVDTRSDEDLVEELRAELLDAVKVRLVGERPLGAFLSGGLDSSAIVGAMSEVSTQPLKTFSIGFESEEFNELPHAARIAERFGTEHHELVVRPEALDIVPRLAAYFDEPYADSSAIPSWYLAQMASEHVVVALNGDGGDEVLAGYTRYQRYLAGGDRRIPRRVARGMQHAGAWLGARSAGRAKVRKLGTGLTLLGESDPARRYARFLSYFRPEEKTQLFTDEFARLVAGHDTYDLVQQVWQENARTDRVNRLLAVDTHTYLPGDLLPKVDITTMSVSLEARSPFLDQQLVEWAAGVPGDRKLSGGTSKVLLKRLLADWVPTDLVHRRKQGFGVPLAEWLRGPLWDLMNDVLLDRTAAERGILSQVTVRRLVDEHVAGVDRSPQLYALMMLELWHREVLAR
jgi:asparagine synthase (glutamine-hydrolysing)